MKEFEFLQPKSLEQASKTNFKNKFNSILYSGGTDVLGLVKDGVFEYDKMINLKSISSLKYINETEDGVRIGALTTLSEITGNELIKKDFPLLYQAAKEVGTPQLRNVGTIAGNICQRPRCFYFRGDFHCLRKGGDECFAISGNNKFHAIIGGGPCYIVHPSDTAVALTALNAEIIIFSNGKEKTVHVGDFFILPEKDHTKENILEPGEIIKEIFIPKNNFNHVKYIKIKERGAWDFAVVSIAVAAKINSNTISSASIAFGGISPIPFKAGNVEKLIKGKTKKAVLSSNINYFPEADPMEMNSYKIHLANNLVKKAFL